MTIKTLKKIAAAALILLGANAVNAQTDFERNWDSIDSLLQKKSYNTCRDKAVKLFAKAQQEKNSRQTLTAAYYLERIESHYREDWHDSALVRYNIAMTTLNPVDRAVCHALMGNDTLSLNDYEALQKIDIHEYKRFCNYDKDTPIVTPTLYDLLANWAVDRTSPEHALQLLEQLIDFHSADTDYVRIWLDIRCLNVLDRIPNRDVTVEMLKGYIEKYRGSKCPLVVRFYYSLAEKLYSNNRNVEAIKWCSEAIDLYPESALGLQCRYLRNLITRPRIQLEINSIIPPNREDIFAVNYRNIDTLWFRVIKKVEFKNSDEATYFSKQKVLHRWNQPVVRDTAYNYRDVQAYLPALPDGQYMLIASPSENLADSGFVVKTFKVSDLMLVEIPGEGYLLHRGNGKPFVGAEVSVYDVKYRRGKRDSVLVDKVYTDKTGHFVTKNGTENYNNRYYTVTYDGHKEWISAPYYRENDSKKLEPQLNIYVNRPVYRPGDTLNFSCLYYHSDKISRGEVVSGRELKVILNDVNDNEIDSLMTITDEFGVATGSFVIPDNGLNGMMNLEVIDVSDGGVVRSQWVRVEEYKQPKFMVKLNRGQSESASITTPSFGKEYRVDGIAAAYSGAPVDGAEVTYTVTRSASRWLWWYQGVSKVVASGKTTTDGEGRFKVTFVPEPDSSIELSRKPSFNYRVEVDVTDLNGETHNAETSVTVGYTNGVLELKLKDTEKSLRDVAYSFTDLNGNALSGDVRLTVERLELPVLPRQKALQMKYGATQPLSRDEFHKRFPMFAYDEVEYDGDSAGREVYTATMKASATADNRFGLPDLPSGRYRIGLTAVDNHGDTIEIKKEVVLMKENSKKVYVKELFWYDINKNRAKPNDTVKIKFGTRFNNLIVTMVARNNDRSILTRQLTLNDELHTVELPVTDDMTGGFMISFIAMLNNEAVLENKFVYVEPADKQLKVTFESFRDKLLPGETETWRMKIDGLSSNQIANLTMTMYDAALNNYGGIGWHTDFWQRANIQYFANRMWYYSNQRYYLKAATFPEAKGYALSQWTLRENSFSRYRMYKSNAVKSLDVASVSVEEEEYEEMIFTMVENDVQSGSARLESVEVVNDLALVGEAGTVGNEPVQMRSNLSTLAFFEPRLRTDEQGRAEFTFTVPELLTQWQLHGFAVSQDLKSSKFVKELITQKELMVQPNVPRFLRFGDSAAFVAKVINMADETKSVEVRFSLSGIDEMIQHIEVPARGSSSVMFGFSVPEDRHVAEYKIMAVSGSCSDGERGEIPVITNRVAVTRSESVYLNGPSTKTMPISKLTGEVMTKSHKPILLSVEFTPNPIWQAIKSLPYIEECASPSMIYLANLLYIKSVAGSIIDKNPLVLDVFKKWQADTSAHISQLARNEEVKQTLLSATPWLCAAENETEQYRSLAKFMDDKKLHKEIGELGRRLTESQRYDGAWSWMPNGEYASRYATSHIVTRIGMMGREVSGSSLWRSAEKGLAYLDREEQNFYTNHIKPQIKKSKLRCEPTNVDYLYTRSFFSNKNENEACKFYYSNALKHYTEFDNLYTQAQLAMTFQRHGDRKAAHDIIRMLKEKSLISDEMGMYWSANIGGYWWYQRPIETQSLIIKAFVEITPDDTVSIALMQQWLLKQKQTTHWGTDVATVNAIDALLTGTTLSEHIDAEVSVSGQPIMEPSEAGTGYITKTWVSDSIPCFDKSITFSKTGNGIAWGAAYYQYEDDIHNVQASATGVNITKTIFKIEPDGTLTSIEKAQLHVGDRLRVRIDISADRTLEFIEIVDGRASCTEPLATTSGWRYNGGLGYYVSVGNTDMRFYINQISKGKYSAEYDAYVTSPGVFWTGLTCWQCMYAPEFRAVAPAFRLKVAGVE